MTTTDLIDALLECDPRKEVFIFMDGEIYEICTTVPVDDSIPDRLDINIKGENHESNTREKSSNTE